MKKSLLLFLFASFVVFANSQEESKTGYSADEPINANENGVVVFSEVVDVEGASAEYLFTNASLWVMNRFRHVKNLFQIEDTVEYILAGEGHIKVDVKYAVTGEEEILFFAFKIQCWDGRYSIEMKNISFKTFEGRHLKVENMITEKHLYRKTGRRPRSINQTYKEITVNFINDSFAGLESRIRLLLNEESD